MITRMMGAMQPRLVLMTALVLGAASLSVAADEFVVIVHPSVAGQSIRRSSLAALFLQKATRWGDESLAVPVDQSGTSAVRKSFSDSVLGMPVGAALQYWQKQMFVQSQLRPPTVKGSDAEVIAFVAKTAGAVGYVSKGLALPPGVKPVGIIE
jgi:ABC-type phosphate transport system substrate-binding protein